MWPLCGSVVEGWLTMDITIEDDSFSSIGDSLVSQRGEHWRVGLLGNPL